MGNVDRKHDADQLKPYIAQWLREAIGASTARGSGGSGGGGSLTPPPPLTTHALATTTGLGTYHTVAGLTAGQVLRAIDATHASFAQLLHSQLGGIGADDHHAKQHALNDGAVHTGTLNWAQLNKTGSDLADLATRPHSALTGVTADQHHNQRHDIVGSDHYYVGGQDLDVFGLTGLSTLGRLRPSADVSAGTSALLRSNLGTLALTVLTAITKVRTPLLDTALGDMEVAPAGDLKLTPGSNSVVIPVAKAFRSEGYTAGFPLGGFRLGPTQLAGQSGLKIGAVEADELRVRIFVSDETRVDRGQQYITKSYGLLSRPFTAPATVGGTADIYFENSPNLGIDGALFTPGDWVLLRYLDIDTGIDLLNCWGQVTGPVVYSNSPDGVREQKWTFTFRSGTPSLAFARGSMGINFGADGQGYILSSAVGDDAPFIQVGKWTTNPYTPANRIVLTQMGRLDGAGFTGEAGIVAAKDNFTSAGTWMKVTTAGAAFNNIDTRWLLAGKITALIEPGGRARFGSDVSAGATTFLDINPATSTATFRGAIEILSGSIPNAKIAGLGGLATKSTVALDTDVTDGTTYKRYATAEQTKLSGIAAGATVGAAWGSSLTGRPVELTDGRIVTALNAGGTVISRVVPAATAAASAAGLYLGSDRMGFYNGSAWRTYMDNAGQFYLTGTGSNALAWDGTTLSITGNITVANSIPNNKITGLGALATKNTAALGTDTTGALGNIPDGGGYSKVADTIVSGGYIRLGWGSTWNGNLNGFELTSTGIRGATGNVTQVSMGTDGAITAGAGNVLLNISGITIASGHKIDNTWEPMPPGGYQWGYGNTWSQTNSLRYPVSGYVGDYFDVSSWAYSNTIGPVAGNNHFQRDVRIVLTAPPRTDGLLARMAVKVNSSGLEITESPLSYDIPGVHLMWSGVRRVSVGALGADFTGNIGVSGGATIGSYVSAGGTGYFSGGMAAIDWWSYGFGVKTATAGGWARGFVFLKANGTDLGGFGAFGGPDYVDHYYIGASYDNTIVDMWPVTKLSQFYGQVATTASFNGGTAFQRNGVAGTIYVPVTPFTMTDTSGSGWGGASRGAGTYYFDVQANGNGLPAGVRAICVLIQGQWAATSNGNFAYLEGEQQLLVAVIRAHTTYTQETQAIVAVKEADGYFHVVVGGATMSGGLLRCVGYFI